MPGLNPKQEDIDQFVAITEASPADAQRFLADGVTLEGALEDFFAAQAAGGVGAGGAGDADMDDEDDLDAALAASAADAGAPEAVGAGRTLSGAPAEAMPAEWAQRAGRMGTIGGLSATDSDDEDERRRHGNELYTGGERSGLAVQNPDDERGGSGHVGLVNDILQQARDAGPLEKEPSAAPAHRWGGGNTLGSDESPSVAVGRSGSRSMPGGFDAGDEEEDENDRDEDSVERRLILWRDGFSVEDGELHRYDNPQSQALLAAIKAGRAPASLWNVAWNQPVQVVIEQRTHEDYTSPPKAPTKAFSGGGNRLGSATHEVAGAGSSASASAPAPAPPAPPQAKPAELKVDASKPVTNIQIRLGDGTRVVARANLDHTVADLRALVAASRPDPRPFVLQTTFPNRELADGETVEQAKLQNAVIVQRFT